MSWAFIFLFFFSLFTTPGPETCLRPFFHLFIIFILFYSIFTSQGLRGVLGPLLIIFLYLLHRASWALFSSFIIILFSSWALVFIFNYPFYFPGPEMCSQALCI